MDIHRIYEDSLKNIQLFIQNNLLISPLVPTPSSEAAKKYLKHEENSALILWDLLSPYEAFKEGCERAIASYIKLGQEDILKTKVVSEQQPKSEETKLLEDLIKSLLNDFDSVKFIKKEDRYLALAGGKLYQFSTLLERVNFNQIELTPSELESYHQLLDSGRLFQTPYIFSRSKRPDEQDFEQLDSEHLCEALTLGEKEAINIYTGNFYIAMNSLMRGNIDLAIECQNVPESFSHQEKRNHCIKETLLHIAVAVSGLNKLPDYQPIGTDGEQQKYLYRAENFLPEDVLKKRQWAVLQGGGITTEMGFLSTAFSKPVSGFFSENTQVGVMIRSLKGKKITPLSQFGSDEREILLPPTQMQWLYQKVITTDINKNPMTLFIAKPVTVKPELTLDYVPLSPQEWLVKAMNDNDEDLLDVDLATV